MRGVKNTAQSVLDMDIKPLSLWDRNVLHSVPLQVKFR